MYRIIMNDLMEWYEGGQDKILLLKGAKGVGKTWTMTDFGHGFYKSLYYVNFEEDEEAADLFRQGGRIKPEKLIAALTMYCGEVYEEGHTFFIFDEVEFCPKAVEAVVSLKRQRPDLPVCMIASTLGRIAQEAEFEKECHPLRLYPMTFEEFLTANKEQNLCGFIERQKIEPVAEEAARRLVEYFSIFYLTGGMPAVVMDYIRNHDMGRVDSILKTLLAGCQAYIDKKVPKSLAYKVNKVWSSIPAQMKKDNRKFMYQYVDKKARAREYEKSVNWLVETGFVRKVNRVAEGIAPLDIQIDEKSFELYHLDHGLLRIMCGITSRQIKTAYGVLEDLNGALLEQYVLSELTMNRTVGPVYFWISGATARVGFVFEDGGEVVPVDVQPQIRRKAQSIKVFRGKYNNRMAIRLSLDALTFGKGVLNIPLYGLWSF